MTKPSGAFALTMRGVGVLMRTFMSVTLARCSGERPVRGARRSPSKSM